MVKNIGRIVRALEKAHGIKPDMEWERRRHSRFQVLIGTILSARTKDESTNKASEQLFRKYPTAEKLAKAPLTEIRKLIRPSGFYKNKAKMIKQTSKIILEQYGGKVPGTMEELVRLPGVGRKVAGCVLVYGFGRAESIPVDTHVHRVSNRIGFVETKTPEKTERILMETTPRKYWLVLNDLFVRHGKTICRPRWPRCNLCPINKYCGYYKNVYSK